MEERLGKRTQPVGPKRWRPTCAGPGPPNELKYAGVRLNRWLAGVPKKILRHRGIEEVTDVVIPDEEVASQA